MYSRTCAKRAAIVCIAVASGLLALAGPLTALADDQVLFFAGGQADFANYVYMGATVALPGATIGNGIALRGYVDTGGYNYISSDLGLVKANFGGGELDAVYQLSRQNFWSNFAIGANDTYTGLAPYDPNNSLRGQQLEMRVGLDGGKIAGPWRADWFGYYGTRLQDYEARLSVTHSLSSLWRLGVEGYGEGNPTYHLRQVGPYAGWSLSQRSELQFSVGPAWESGFAPRAYFRALIYQRF